MEGCLLTDLVQGSGGDAVPLQGRGEKPIVLDFVTGVGGKPTVLDFVPKTGLSSEDLGTTPISKP